MCFKDYTGFDVIHNKLIIFGDNFAVTSSHFTKLGKRIWIHMSDKFHWRRYNDLFLFWSKLKLCRNFLQFSQSRLVIGIYPEVSQSNKGTAGFGRANFRNIEGVIYIVHDIGAWHLAGICALLRSTYCESLKQKIIGKRKLWQFTVFKGQSLILFWDFGFKFCVWRLHL